MNTSYNNIFKQARDHPEYKKYYNDSQAKLLLAEKIYNARSEAKLTMKELAEKANTTAAVISRIENAQVSAGIDLISRIFLALGINEVVLKFG